MLQQVGIALRKRRFAALFIVDVIATVDLDALNRLNWRAVVSVRSARIRVQTSQAAGGGAHGERLRGQDGRRIHAALAAYLVHARGMVVQRLDALRRQRRRIGVGRVGHLGYLRIHRVRLGERLEFV